MARLGVASQTGISRPVRGPLETEWRSWPRPPRKRRHSQECTCGSGGTGKSKKKREAQAEPTFFNMSGGPSRKARIREGRSRGSDASRVAGSEVQRSRKTSEGGRSGNQASRQARLEPKGPTGAERLRPEPLRGERSRLHRFEWPPGKVGAGGNASPHFHIRPLPPSPLTFDELAAASEGAPIRSRLGARFHAVGVPPRIVRGHCQRRSRRCQIGIEINPICPAFGMSRLVTTPTAAPSRTPRPRRRT